jgi:flagellar protein FliJ
MSRFRFTLATLLRLRQSARDERRTELADAQQSDAMLQEHITRLKAEQERLQSERRVAGGPGELDLHRLVEAQQFAASLGIQAAELCEQRRTLAAEIGHRREALLEADRDLRTTEKLRDNQAQAFQQEMDRQTAKQLDEAGLQRRQNAPSEFMA